MSFKCEKCSRRISAYVVRDERCDSVTRCPKCGEIIEADYGANHQWVTTGERSGVSGVRRCTRCKREEWHNPMHHSRR
jgi:DNA-directed RNA polymerase subunit RPC12/RpoP